MLRLISPRAMWPQITATTPAMNGIRIQLKMPAIRLATASALVLEAGAAGALAGTGGGVADSLVMAVSSGYRSNLMPCASGNASE